jgi:response regulator RpfG family c-di-GMP phosphodiesterase
MNDKLLLVVKDKELEDKLKNWLKNEKVKVFTARSTNEISEIARKEFIDFIILDASSSKHNNHFLEFMEEDIKLRKLPMIIIKEKSQPNVINGYTLCIEDFINKPLDQLEFITRVRIRLRKGSEIKQLHSEYKQLKTLLQINSLIHNTLNLEELSPLILPIIIDLFKAESAAIFLKDEAGEPFLASYRGNVLQSDLVRLLRNVSKEQLRMGKPLWIKDIGDDPKFPKLRLERKEDFHTLASLPLQVDNDSIGTLEIYNFPPSYINDERMRQFMQNIAYEVGKVLRLSRRFTHIYKSSLVAREEMAILYEISNALGSTLNLAELLRLIVRNALRSFDAQVVSLMMVDEETQELSIRFAEGLSPEIMEATRIKIGEGIAGKVARTGQPLLLVDVVGLQESDLEKGIKSALSVPLKIQDKVIGVINVSKTSHYKFTEEDLKLLYNLGGLAAQAIEKAQLYQDIRDSLNEVKDSYLSTVNALSKAIEAKDPYTQGHVDRVAKYGLAIAMELNPELLKDDMFRYALVLHDVGKIEIPDRILSKPGPLTEEEMAIVRRHPEAGADIISPIKFLSQAADMVRYHQERFDGKGYPRGLKSEEIPMVARIIAVADAFDAMTTDRPYRERASIEEACKEIAKNSGKQFDPQVVKAFLSAVDKKLIP